MKKYNVKSEKKRVYRLMDGDRELGVLCYPKWYSLGAEVESFYKKFSIVPVGFWKSTMRVLENERELMSYHMSWKGAILFSGREKSYELRSEGIFTRRFILTEVGSKDPVLSVTYKMRWRKMLYDFELESTEVFEALEDKDFFLLTIVSAVRYYIAVISAAAA